MLNQQPASSLGLAGGAFTAVDQDEFTLQFLTVKHHLEFASRKLLLEKRMRDAKINDLFEGTGQINRLIIARRILGYTSKELK